MLITNAKLITWEEPNRILEDYGLFITQGLIADLGPTAEMVERYPGEAAIDAAGQYVMPGQIIAHTHFYGAYARGLAIPGPAPKDFTEILQKLWWPLDLALTMDDVRASAEVMLVDAIRHGATTLIDHHASPNAIEGSLDVIAQAVDRSGLRAVLCYEVTDRNGSEGAQAGIEENVRFINRTRRQAVAGGRVAATFGLHASLTLSEETLEACRAAAPEGVGFHIHVAEHELDEYDSVAKSGRRVVDRLADHGILTPFSIAAHAVHVDALRSGIVAREPYLGHPPAALQHEQRCRRRGGPSRCCGPAFRFAWVQMASPQHCGMSGKRPTWYTKFGGADPRRMSAAEVARMGAYNNARLAGSFFPSAPLGRIEVGAHADLILVDYHPHTPLTAENLPWQIVFGFNESMITTTIAAGQVLMKDRQILVLDEEAITAHAREQAPAVWQRYAEQF